MLVDSIDSFTVHCWVVRFIKPLFEDSISHKLEGHREVLTVIVSPKLHTKGVYGLPFQNDSAVTSLTPEKMLVCKVETMPVI